MRMYGFARLGTKERRAPYSHGTQNDAAFCVPGTSFQTRNGNDAGRRRVRGGDGARVAVLNAGGTQRPPDAWVMALLSSLAAARWVRPYCTAAAMADAIRGQRLLDFRSICSWFVSAARVLGRAQRPAARGCYIRP